MKCTVDKNLMAVQTGKEPGEGSFPLNDLCLLGGDDSILYLHLRRIIACGIRTEHKQ